MDKDTMASAFNAWMDDFTKNPEAFTETHILAMKHLNEKLDGREPTYGEVSAALLQEYAAKSSP